LNGSKYSSNKFNLLDTAILIYSNSQIFEHDDILKGLLLICFYTLIFPAYCVDTSLYLLLFHSSICWALASSVS
jgi:hypothetical protein